MAILKRKRGKDHEQISQASISSCKQPVTFDWLIRELGVSYCLDMGICAVSDNIRYKEITIAF